jgi:hypothetical protein
MDLPGITSVGYDDKVLEESNTSLCNLACALVLFEIFLLDIKNVRLNYIFSHV